MSFQKVALVAFIASSVLVSAGCASDEPETAAQPTSASTPSAEQREDAEPEPAEEPPAEPVTLVGEWTQSNSSSDDNYQSATITDDSIEVYWVSDGGDTKSLYWAGSIEVPADAGDSFTWDSANDTSKTDSALLASGDDTKTFTYEAGEISYEVSALGTTSVVRLTQE